MRKSIEGEKKKQGKGSKHVYLDRNENTTFWLSSIQYAQLSLGNAKVLRMQGSCQKKEFTQILPAKYEREH